VCCAQSGKSSKSDDSGGILRARVVQAGNRASSAGIHLRPVYALFHPAAIQLLPDSALLRAVLPGRNLRGIGTRKGSLDQQ